MDDRSRIAHLEGRLALGRDERQRETLAELEMLADLYVQADRYLPALETIDRLLSLPAAATLSRDRRAAIELKAVACRLAQGDCQAALAQCRDLLTGEAEIGSTVLRARLHLYVAKALLHLGRIAECRVPGERGLEIAETGHDFAQAADALSLLGLAAFRSGELPRARDLFEQALGLFRRLGDEDNVSNVRNNLGLVHKNLCEWEAATAHLTAALRSHRDRGRYADTAKPLINLGIVYQKSGRWDRALECYREAEQVFAQVNDQLRLANVAIGIGNIARLQRRFAESETALLGALERARAHGARREEVLAIEFLGELDYDRGRAESAVARYHEALRLAERTAPEADLVVELERRRAEALCALGRHDEATTALDRARRLARQTDDRLEHAVSWRVEGEIALANGDRHGALERWGTATRLLSDCRERFELAKTQLLIGRYATEARGARAALFQACATFADIGSVHWQDLAEAELQRVMGPEHAPAPARADSALGRRHRAPSLVACSPAMRQIEGLARRAAATELSVLITGETGTGKELVARTIHTLSPRANKPFLAVNCGALRADLALSQLFGHRKGAFTGAHAEGVGLVEAANGGTLFLDEAGELPLDVQVTLLRFLESGEYLRLGETQVRRSEVRIIAATNRVLRGVDGEKSFRRDLLYRLNEIEIRLPSLRERREDIVPLARHFLAFYGGIEGPRLAPASESVLASHAWPGNVRELENVMKRVAALHADSAVIGAIELLPFLSTDPSPLSDGTPACRDREREEILAAMQTARGNKSRVAELLGVSRKTLYARIKRLNLEL